MALKEGTKDVLTAIMVGNEQIRTVGRGLLIRAPAKINLSLLVAGKRPDSFHEIETVMAKIDFFDEILIEPGAGGGIEFVCEGSQWAPAGEDNLVFRAARMLLDDCGRAADIRITLIKNVPAGSGLGSASSDAAAALIGLNEYLNLGLSSSDLAGPAERLGSDVPFFLNGPLALCKGKGEKIQKLASNFDFLALLILPNVNVSTAKVYAAYEHDHAGYERLSGVIKGYIEKNRIDLVVGMCANMLKSSCFGLVKGLAELKGRIEALGVKPLCLSGSGTALFCLMDSRDEAEAVRIRLEQEISCTSRVVSNSRW